MLWRWAAAQVCWPLSMRNSVRGADHVYSVRLRHICNPDVCSSLRSGVYRTWDECKAQVHQFPAAIHKAFKSNGEAAAFIDKHGQSRGFACSGGAQAADDFIVSSRAAKRRRKAAKVAAATPAALQESRSDGHISDAQPDHAAALCADADTAAGSAAAGATVPTIWSSMLYRLVSADMQGMLFDRVSQVVADARAGSSFSVQVNSLLTAGV